MGALLLCATCVVMIARPSSAQEVTGVVLTLDGAEVIVDLGRKQGVSDNDILELWRPIKIKHPVSGKLVSDRFRIGSLKITQAREVMSLAKPTAPLARLVEAGDVVILVGTPKSPVVTPPPKPATSGAPTTTTTTTAAPPVVVDADPEVRALGTLFESLHGTSPEVRAKAYEDFIKANPKSRFAGVLQEEIIALRAAGMGAAAAPATAASAPTVAAVRSWRKVDEVPELTAFVYAIELDGPVAGAVMQLRAADEPAFTPIPFVARGDGYWAVTIPKERVRGPTLSWFVEAVGPDGKAQQVIGSASDTMTTKVVARPGSILPLNHKNSAVLWTDYADYNRWRGNDYAFQTEGYFGMRFGDVGVRAVRSGFGVYRGKGGSIQELDKDVPPKDPRSVGLSYGYLEGEFGLDPFWAIIARVIVGLGNDGVNGGGQGFLRIGNDQKTNLMIGGEILGGIGLRGITQLQLALHPKIPILVRSEVTNQPAGERKYVGPASTTSVSQDAGEIGVRAIAQVGYRFTPALTLFVRGSYQGRTIVHAGPGFGAGVSVEW